MQKVIVSVSALFIVIMLFGTVCFSAAPSADYELLICDEFNEDTLNPDLWAYRFCNKIRKLCLLYKECDSSGRFVNCAFIRSADVFTSIPMINSENEFTVFLWESINSMKPLIQPIE